MLKIILCKIHFQQSIQHSLSTEKPFFTDKLIHINCSNLFFALFFNIFYIFTTLINFPKKNCYQFCQQPAAIKSNNYKLFHTVCLSMFVCDWCLIMNKKQEVSQFSSSLTVHINDVSLKKKLIIDDFSTY